MITPKNCLLLMSGMKLSISVKKNPLLSPTIIDLLNDLNQTTIDDIYKILMDPAKRFKDFYTKKIYHAAEKLIFFLFESNPNPLKQTQLEHWYQCNLWCNIIDDLFENVNEVICVCGESSSLASRERKNI
ncbi:unnamed protein product [Cunninghamella blakesleeana]